MGEVESTSELGLAPEETASRRNRRRRRRSALPRPTTSAARRKPADTAELVSPTDLADATAEPSVRRPTASRRKSPWPASPASWPTGSEHHRHGHRRDRRGGVNVLGESSTDFNVTEDSMAETAVGPAGSKRAKPPSKRSKTT